MADKSYKETILEALKRVPKTIKLPHIAAETNVPAQALRTFRSRGTLGSTYLRMLEVWLTSEGYLEPRLGEIYFDHPIQAQRWFPTGLGDVASLPTHQELEDALSVAMKLKNSRLHDELSKILETKFEIHIRAQNLRVDFDNLRKRLGIPVVVSPGHTTIEMLRARDKKKKKKSSASQSRKKPR